MHVRYKLLQIPASALFCVIIMVKLSCNDYGYDCDFEVEGKNIELVITRFGQHTHEEHGIEYPKEALMQFILRKRN